MPYYKVKKVYKYTEDVYLQAASVNEAEHKACGIDGERNHDDLLYDTIAEEIIEKEHSDSNS